MPVNDYPTTSGGVSDHGALSGLSDDDHSQYLLRTSAGTMQDGEAPVYDGTTGRELRASGVTMAAGVVNATDLIVSGTTTANTVSAATVTVSGTINGDDPDDWVVGPASATNRGIPQFNGTSGKSLASTAATVDTAGNIACGNLNPSGTVDGRDVAADGTKLDGIESGADVTDATNVAAAGAVMDSDFGKTGLMVRTGAGTYTAAMIDSGYGASVANGDGIAGDPAVAVSLAAGHYYSGTTSATWTTTPTTIPYDTATTALANMSVSSGEFTASADMTIVITANVAANLNSGSTSSWYALLEVDTGSGFAELQYARTSGVTLSTVHDWQSSTLSCVIALSSGHKFRIQGARASGAAIYEWRGGLGYNHITILRIA